MGLPAEKPRRATYADVAAVPSHRVAELIRGTLHVLPRPASRHARAATGLGAKLVPLFDHGSGGPGGWIILHEPELHFPDPTSPGAIDVLVPDVAGWRRARMPELPETASFSLAPDWVCEIPSKSTERVDREEKLPIYAREGVPYAWLVDPIARSLELYRLDDDRRWRAPIVHDRDIAVRVPPFEAIELDLSVLWAR